MTIRTEAKEIEKLATKLIDKFERFLYNWQSDDGFDIVEALDIGHMYFPDFIGEIRRLTELEEVVVDLKATEQEKDKR